MPITNRLIGRNSTNRDPWSILNILINSAMKTEMLSKINVHVNKYVKKLFQFKRTAKKE